MPRLLSVNVGLPRDVTWNLKTVRTSVWKSPVDGRRMVRKLDIDGDAQADLAGHGGEQRAVFVYQMDSYHHWERFLGRRAFAFGQFGENFTVEGLSDNEVCIGDRYRIGGAEFEVTQPRVTSYRVTIRTAWDPKFASLLELAEACDVTVRWSCRIGVCHTCMAGLVDGSISYNPEPLERPTSGNVLICCSQPNSGVTLDL
jgi:ferredoxin